MNGSHLGLYSYASFSGKKFPSGGWQIGEIEGNINRQVADKLKRWIPSSLDNGQEFAKYPPNDIRERLLRRFAWLPVGISNTGTEWTFYASAFAGYDASGRPGNVYTVVAHSPDGRLEIPAGRLPYSPQIPAPFGSKQVDNAELPTRLNEPGPLTGEVLNFFVEGWDGDSPLPSAWSNVEPFNQGPTRAELVWLCRYWLEKGQKVVIACPPEESVLWICTVLKTLDYQWNVSFSTFENPNTIGEVLAVGCHITTIPDFRADSARETIEAAGAKLVKISEALPLPREEFCPAATEEFKAQPKQEAADHRATPAESPVPAESPAPARKAAATTPAPRSAPAPTPTSSNPFGNDNPFGTESLLSDDGDFGSGFEKQESLSLELDPEDKWSESPAPVAAREETSLDLNLASSRAPRSGSSQTEPGAQATSEEMSSNSPRSFSANIVLGERDEYFFAKDGFLEKVLRRENFSEDCLSGIARFNQLLLVKPRQDRKFAVLRARLFFLLMRNVDISYCSVDKDFADLNQEEYDMVIAEIFNLLKKHPEVGDPRAFFTRAQQREDIFPPELETAYRDIVNRILTTPAFNNSPQKSVDRSY